MKKMILGICLLGAACSQGKLSFDGEERELTSIEGSSFTNIAGDTIIGLDILSDPLKNAIDDEISISLSITLLQPTESGETIELTPETAQVTVSYGCECDTSGIGPLEITGAITTKPSLQNLRGEISLQITGADANGIDLGLVEINTPFRAKVDNDVISAK